MAENTTTLQLTTTTNPDIITPLTHQILHSAPSYLQYIFLAILASLSLGYVIDSGYGSRAGDSREPKKLRPWFPLVGHVVGMLVGHTRYYDDL